LVTVRAVPHVALNAVVLIVRLRLRMTSGALEHGVIGGICMTS